MTLNQKALPGGVQLRATVWKGAWRGRWRPLPLPSCQVTWAESSVSWIPCHVQHLEGESGGGCMFACAFSHISMCTHVYTYVGGVCMCEWCLRVEGSESVLSCLAPCRQQWLPSPVGVFRAGSWPKLCSQQNKSWEPPAPNSTSSCFSSSGCYAFSLSFPLINLLLGEALIGLDKVLS